MTVFFGIEPVRKIEEEDVLTPRVVRYYRDIVIVLDNPREGRNPKYPGDKLDDDKEERPRFVVSRSKGFQVYAKTSVATDPNDPDGEPLFQGTLVTDRMMPPTYQIHVKL